MIDRVSPSAAEAGSAGRSKDVAIGRCSDCPPVNYPTDKTRCMECPRRKLAEDAPVDSFDSTIDSIRHASCCKKIRYRSQWQAEDGRQELLVKYGYDVPLHVYRCVFCNYHHIGRNAKGSGLKIRTDLARMLRYGFCDPCPRCKQTGRDESTVPQHSGGGAL